MPEPLAQLLETDDPAGALQAMRAEAHPEPEADENPRPWKVARETYTALLKRADPLTALCAQLMVKRGEWIICG